MIDPEAVPANPQPPPVVIEALLLDRAPVAPSFDRPVRIAPGRENFEIQYTALSFVNSEHLKFKYRLEGLDRRLDRRRDAPHGLLFACPAGRVRLHRDCGQQ